jgi:tetratricopeptide (TPR) repeat protein
VRWGASCCALLLIACRTSGTPEPENPSPVPQASTVSTEPAKVSPQVAAAEDPPCAKGGPACYARAESILESDAKRGESLLDACVACDDAPPSAFRLLATAREDRGAKVEARECLRQGIAKYPSSDLLWVALARIEISTGRPREALSAYAHAERLRPADEVLANEYHDALERFGTDEEKRESIVSQLVLEAAGRAETGDLKGAEQTLKIAREKAGRVSRLLGMVDLKIAMVLVRRGEHSRALSLLEPLQRNNALDASLRAEAQVACSEVLLALKRPRDAVKAAESAIALEPMNVLAHANLGVAWAASGEKDRAMTALKKACELGLPRRLTFQEFMAIGPAIESLKARADFNAMVRAAWPRAAREK